MIWHRKIKTHEIDNLNLQIRPDRSHLEPSTTVSKKMNQNVVPKKKNRGHSHLFSQPEHLPSRACESCFAVVPLDIHQKYSSNTPDIYHPPKLHALGISEDELENLYIPTEQRPSIVRSIYDQNLADPLISRLPPHKRNKFISGIKFKDKYPPLRKDNVNGLYSLASVDSAELRSSNNFDNCNLSHLKYSYSHCNRNLYDEVTHKKSYFRLKDSKYLNVASKLNIPQPHHYHLTPPVTESSDKFLFKLPAKKSMDKQTNFRTRTNLSSKNLFKWHEPRLSSVRANPSPHLCRFKNNTKIGFPNPASFKLLDNFPHFSPNVTSFVLIFLFVFLMFFAFKIFSPIFHSTSPSRGYHRDIIMRHHLPDLNSRAPLISTAYNIFTWANYAFLFTRLRLRIVTKQYEAYDFTINQSGTCPNDQISCNGGGGGRGLKLHGHDSHGNVSDTNVLEKNYNFTSSLFDVAPNVRARSRKNILPPNESRKKLRIRRHHSTAPVLPRPIERHAQPLPNNLSNSSDLSYDILSNDTRPIDRQEAPLIINNFIKHYFGLGPPHSATQVTVVRPQMPKVSVSFYSPMIDPQHDASRRGPSYHLTPPTNALKHVTKNIHDHPYFSSRNKNNVHKMKHIYRPAVSDNGGSSFTNGSSSMNPFNSMHDESKVNIAMTMTHNNGAGMLPTHHQLNKHGEYHYDDDDDDDEEEEYDVESDYYDYLPSSSTSENHQPSNKPITSVPIKIRKDTKNYATPSSTEPRDSDHKKILKITETLQSSYKSSSSILFGNLESFAKNLPASMTYADLQTYLFSAINKKLHKFHSRNSFMLQIASDGTVNGTTDQNSEHSLFQITSIGSYSAIQLFGIKSKRFVCMDQFGRLFSTIHGKAKPHCTFIKSRYGQHYFTLHSVISYPLPPTMNLGLTDSDTNSQAPVKRNFYIALDKKGHSIYGYMAHRYSKSAQFFTSYH